MSLTMQRDALDMIRQGGEEWVAAAVHVGMADNDAEAWELYDDERGDEVTMTLADMVVSYWKRNGGYIRQHEGKVIRYIFADDKALDA